MDTQQLSDFYRRVFPTRCKIWYIIKDPSADVKGAGRLAHSPKQMAEVCHQAASAGRTIHFGVTGYKEPSIIGPLFVRKKLSFHARHAIILDIDFKDQALTSEQEITAAIAKTNLPPSAVVATSNGMHVYYMFDEDVQLYAKNLHGAISAVYGREGLEVDPMGATNNISTIRAPGTVGKCGQMVLDGDATGPSYMMSTVSDATGLSIMADPPPTYNVPVHERSIWDRARINSQLQAPRHHVRLSCVAFDKFIELSDTSFNGGQRGGYPDIRMFSSIVAHTFDPEDRSTEERRDYAMSVMMKWPGAEEGYIGSIYDSVVGDGTATFKCDKWSPAYRSECLNCPHYHRKDDNGQPISPLVATQIATTPVQPIAAVQALTPMAVPATPIQQTQSVSGVVVNKVGIGGALIGALPSNEFSIDGSNMTLFRHGLKAGAKGAPPVPVSVAICSPAARVISRTAPIYGTVEADFGGYVIRNDANGMECTLSTAALNNPHELRNGFSRIGIYIENVLELQKYINLCTRDGQRDIEHASSMGWNDECTQFNAPGYTLRANDARRVSIPKELGYKLGKDYVPKGSAGAWLDQVLKPMLNLEALDGHTYMVLSSFASVLYKLTNQNTSGPHITLVGGSGLGKSTAVNIAGSVWYDANEFMLNNADTGPARDRILGSFAHLPLTIDELTSQDPVVLKDLVYNFTQGHSRSAMKTGGNKGYEMRDGEQWSTVILGSANVSIVDMLKNVPKCNQAILERAVDVVINAVATRHTHIGDVLVSALSAAESNSGEIGLAWATHLLQPTTKARVTSAIAGATAINNGVNRFCWRHNAMINSVCSEMALLGWMTQDQVDRIGAFCTKLEATVRSRTNKALVGRVMGLNEFMNAFIQHTYPADKDEYMTYIDQMALSPNSRLPDSRDMIHQDAEFIYVRRTTLERHLKPTMPQGTVLNDFVTSHVSAWLESAGVKFEEIPLKRMQLWTFRSPTMCIQHSVSSRHRVVAIPRKRIK